MALVLLLAVNLARSGEEPAEASLRIVPLVTSTPLTGTGVGVSTSYLYSLGDTASESQLQVGGQYSNTESITLFIRNNAFFKNNDIFPAGHFRARYLNGAQTEYRYVIDGTPYKLTAFARVAALQGGSYGDGDSGQERDDDGTYWAGGIGLRYSIQRRTGVDLRLDLVTTSENAESVYLTLNQAF